MLKVGDWVTQYSKGYWQIVDIKPKYADSDYSSETVKWKKGDLLGSWVLLKKAFTPKMKFRLASEFCDSTWCKPIDDDIKKLIDTFFFENPEAYDKFLNYNTPPDPQFSTYWVQLSQDELSLLESVLKSLPQVFTEKEAFNLFSQYGLSHCFRKPPANFCLGFECYPWELDPDFNQLYKNTKII